MHNAMNEANRREYELGLLFCKHGLEKVYSLYGWKMLLKNELLCSSPILIC